VLFAIFGVSATIALDGKQLPLPLMPLNKTYEGKHLLSDQIR
jgi:hypothetical protein